MIRRAEVTQESFAKYAYFTDFEPSNISFGGDQLFGPVHSNDEIKIYESRATFHGPVTTAKYVSGSRYGTFHKGYEEYVTAIPMPETAELGKLRDLARPGNMAFTSNTNGSPSQAEMRIEFVFAGGDVGDVVVADNTLNAPYRPRPVRNSPGSDYITFDDTSDEFIHAVVLALNIFTADNYDDGADRSERCEGTNWGRGCLYLTGGIIQRTRGGVGTSGGTGYIKRYSYDSYAFASPPPYFPTTGHFTRGHYFEVDPVGFDIDEYFDRLTTG